MKFALVAFAFVAAVVSQDQPADLFLQASDDAIVHAYTDLLTESDVLRNEFAFLGQLIADADTAANQVPAASSILQELTIADEHHETQKPAEVEEKVEIPEQELFEFKEVPEE